MSLFRILISTGTALVLLLWASAFLIAPVWQPGYHPVAYEPPCASAAEERPWDETMEERLPCVNVNTATEEELQALSGIGPSKAAAIVAYREENGPFRSLGDLAEVSGISAAMVEAWTAAGVICLEGPENS